MAQIQFSRLFVAEIELVAKFLEDKFKERAVLQGHKNTGKLLASHSFEIYEEASSIAAFFYAEHYAGILDSGVPASRVPFTLGSGKDHSELIEGLETWLSSKGDTDPLRGAFRIARAAKAKDGFSSLASNRFSSTGTRRGFIGETIDVNSGQISVKMQKAVDDFLQGSLDAIFLKLGKV